MEYDPNQSDPLRALGLPPEASQQDVQRAYRRLLKQFRPERDPAGFQKLRQVLERALEVAASNREVNADSELPAHPEPHLDDGVSDADEFWDAALFDPLPRSEEYSALFQAAASDLESGDIDEAIARLESSQGTLALQDPNAWTLEVAELARHQLPSAPEACQRLLGQAKSTELSAGPAFDQLEDCRWLLAVSEELMNAESDAQIFPSLTEFIRQSLFIGPSRRYASKLIPLQQAATDGKWSPQESFKRLRDSAPLTYSVWRELVEENTQWVMLSDLAQRSPEDPKSIGNRTERLAKRLQQIRTPQRASSFVPTALAAITVAPFVYLTIVGRRDEVGKSATIWPRFACGAAFWVLRDIYEAVRKHYYRRKHWRRVLRQFNTFGIPILGYLQHIDSEPPEMVAGAIDWMNRQGNRDAFDLANLAQALLMRAGPTENSETPS